MFTLEWIFAGKVFAVIFICRNLFLRIAGKIARNPVLQLQLHLIKILIIIDWGPFLEGRQAVVVYIQDRGFSSFASNMIKLSVKETKWSSLLARTRDRILYILIWKFDFGTEKLPGLSRNGPLAGKIAIANLGGPVKRKIKWKERSGRKIF